MTATQSEYGCEQNRSRSGVGGGVMLVKQVCSLPWGGMVSALEHFFWKHKKQSSEFKLVRRVLRKALLERMKHSCKSHVKYSLGFFFSLRNHPEVWECAQEHDWYIISVSGLWSWTWPSHVLWKGKNIGSFFLFFFESEYTIIKCILQSDRRSWSHTSKRKRALH